MDHNSHAIECPGLYFGHFHIWDPLLALAGSVRVDGASPRRPPRVSLAKVLSPLRKQKCVDVVPAAGNCVTARGVVCGDHSKGNYIFDSLACLVAGTITFLVIAGFAHSLGAIITRSIPSGIPSLRVVNIPPASRPFQKAF